jgi:hypothetical protein
MSRFAVVYEDPEYEEPVASDWAELLDGFVTVAEKQQSSDPWQQIEDPHLVDI